MENKIKIGEAVKLNYFGRTIYGRFYGVDEFSEFIYGETPKVLVLTPKGNELKSSSMYLEKITGKELEKFLCYETYVKIKFGENNFYGGLLKNNRKTIEKEK